MIRGNGKLTAWNCVHAEKAAWPVSNNAAVRRRGIEGGFSGGGDCVVWRDVRWSCRQALSLSLSLSPSLSLWWQSTSLVNSTTGRRTHCPGNGDGSWSSRWLSTSPKADRSWYGGTARLRRTALCRRAINANLHERPVLPLRSVSIFPPLPCRAYPEKTSWVE